jgi:uncharacterized surface protein with fasciclin (FAS1) repeats
MHNITRRAMGALTLTTLLALTACASLSSKGPAANALVLADQTAELSTFSKMVKQAGMQAALEGQGPFTVFAPTDEAFKALPEATLDKLSKDPVALKALLSYHVVPGTVKTADIGGNGTLATLNGAKLSSAKAGDFVTVDESLITGADKVVANGVVHVIDRVLTPPAKK